MQFMVRNSAFRHFELARVKRGSEEAVCWRRPFRMSPSRQAQRSTLCLGRTVRTLRVSVESVSHNTVFALCCAVELCSVSVTVYHSSRHFTQRHWHAGTGKSSLVCALCLGLGGNTRVRCPQTAALQRPGHCAEPDETGRHRFIQQHCTKLQCKRHLSRPHWQPAAGKQGEVAPAVLSVACD